MESKTNVVLVHGAWADGSCWSKVIPILQNKGYYVTAVQLPLTSLTDDIAVTKKVLTMQKGPTVLVGHSYGGAVITGAAKGNPNVSALVYIAAFGLDEGESLASLARFGPPTAGSAQVRPDQYGFLWIDQNGFAKVFAADVDLKEANVMASVQKPLSIKSTEEKSGAPAWKDIKSWFLVSGNDLMIPPPAQELMAKRMYATTRKISASHASMVSQPKEVADMIIQAAEKR